MGGKNNSVFRWLWDLSRAVDRARAAKRDPEKRKKVFRFGVSAALAAFLSAACAPALLLFPILFEHGILIAILLLIVAVGFGVAGTLAGIASALVYWFCQLYVNRGAGTWISLAFMLAGFGVVAAVLVILF